MARRIKYSREVKDFIAANAYGHSVKELVQLVNENYGMNLTVGKVRSFIGNHNLRTGTSSRLIKYSEEVKEFIAANAHGHSVKELIQLVNEKFGTDFNVSKMRSFMANYNLRTGTSKGRKKGCATIVFPEDIRAFIKNNYKGCGPTLMTALLNETFGTSYVYNQVKYFYKRHNLKSGVTGGLPKDYMDDRANIIKYCVPVDGEGINQAGYLPLGTERVGSHGYLEVKISAFPSKWRGKHLLVWEKHKGPIPKGHVVIFADGDKLNVDVNNLILISKAQSFIMSRKNLRQSDADLTRTGVMVARVYEKIYERRKENK